MPYQLTFAMYLIATTIHSLLARRYATKTTLHPLLSGIPTNLTIALPFAIIYALSTGGLQIPSLSFALISIVEAAIGTFYGMITLYAQKHSDASTFVTLIKLHVVLVVAMSSVFLGESLTPIQLLGGALILLGGMLLGKGIHKQGLRYNLLTIPVLAAVVILSRILVIEAGVGMYMVTTMSLGLIIKLLIKGRYIRSNLPEIRAEFKQRATMSLFTSLQILLFIVSVDLSGNVSLISSLASIKVVTVTVASFVFLNERSNLRVKILASTLSAIGLVLM